MAMSDSNARTNRVPLHKPRLCHHCVTLQPQSNNRCVFCFSMLHHPGKHSLQKTWAYLITAIVLYIPANMLPIMNTNSLGNESPSTIVGGVILMWEHGSYPVALIIFIASIVVPIAKFLILIGLCLSEQFNRYNKPHSKMLAYRLTEFIGRWSMVDVFVVAFLASLIQLGNLMSVYPGPAVLAFAGMVISTMLAASSFDSSVFWNNDEH